MKKNTNIFVAIMAVIGVICTAVVLVIIFKDRIKECPVCKKYFKEDEDLDLDFDLDEGLLEEAVSEEVKEEVPEATEEETVHVPKARRGYIPLKFETTDIA